MKQFKPELKIGNAPWFTTGQTCDSKEQAESIAGMFAKWWLGAAESRSSPLCEESNIANEAKAEWQSTGDLVNSVVKKVKTKRTILSKESIADAVTAHDQYKAELASRGLREKF